MAKMLPLNNICFAITRTQHSAMWKLIQILVCISLNFGECGAWNIKLLFSPSFLVTLVLT